MAYHPRYTAYAQTGTAASPQRRAIDDVAYATTLARTERNATDRLRGNTDPAHTAGSGELSGAHDWAGFNKSFPQAPQSSGGISNPPAAFDYAAGAMAAGPRTVARQFQMPSPVTGPGGNRTTDAANLAANRALYQPSAGIAPQPSSLAASPVGSSRILGATESDALLGQGTNPGAVAAATGRQQRTPYGTVGAGPNDWQQIVMKNHPEIGIAGSQANSAFVDAYKKAQAAGGQVDPHAIAAQVMQNITNPQQPMATPPGMQTAENGIQAPSPINGAQAPVMFAGQNVGPSDWSPMETGPTASGRTAGQGLRQRISDTMNEPDSPMSIAGDLAGAAKSAGNAIGNAYQSAKGFVGGLFSSPPPSDVAQPSPTPSAPSFPLTDPSNNPGRMSLSPDLANYDPDKVANYAGGFAPAMKREKQAIAKGVGGAQPGDKPVPVMLAGQPAVVNSGEKIVPNMAGGKPAVLNRKMQRRLLTLH